jgi:hypothetical protein
MHSTRRWRRWACCRCWPTAPTWPAWRPLPPPTLWTWAGCVHHHHRETRILASLAVAAQWVNGVWGWLGGRKVATGATPLLVELPPAQGPATLVPVAASALAADCAYVLDCGAWWSGRAGNEEGGTRSPDMCVCVCVYVCQGGRCMCGQGQQRRV